ncbi:MAG: Nif3-like dinuclear metal center hexameric protein [Clostridia bacterium]|nr:Nif3-like dinuclear metal center hexameric protein [Clostridia bacterium]
MKIKCKDIVSFLEKLAPPDLAEDWDNVGLILGSSRQVVEKVLVCLDVTDKVAEEAVSNGIDLIVSHHPLIFKEMKRITEDDFKGKLIYNLIKNNISVYSAHTNLDVADGGINECLAEIIGLREVKNLNKYKSEKLYKIVVFVPADSIERVREAMCNAGAGWIGNYSDCSFSIKGTGTFKPLEGTNPYMGKKGILEKVDEYRLETIVPQSLLNNVIDAMLNIHPYEEVAYDVYELARKGKENGLGKVGLLSKPMKLEEFLMHIKKVLNAENVRLIGNSQKEIKKVAVFCGSFDQEYSGIEKSGADILVTGDIKYHTALEMIEKGLCVIDAGHYNTERIIVPKLVSLINDKFKGIKVAASDMEEDPIKFS